MFIGILTEEVIHATKQDKLIGSFVDIDEAAKEVGRICNTYKTDDIDFTVLLTHIGFEADKELAKALDPRWGVDVIIGGHSHTLLEKAEEVAGIPIVQAAYGTSQIGRFDININTDENCIDSYEWNLIPIDDTHCPRDLDLEEVIDKYIDATDEKYGRLITRFAEKYTHPQRNRETQLGKIFADVFRDNMGLDVMLLASGSLRETQMGPIVQYRNLAQMFPYTDELFRIKVTGAQLKHMIEYLYREDALNGCHTEFYQYSRGMKVVVSIPERKVLEITFEGEPIDDERIFRVGLQGFHFKSMDKFFDITEEEVKKNAPIKMLATNVMDVVDENLSNMEFVTCPEEDRWITIE
jgi:5'-nucleotidase